MPITATSTAPGPAALDALADAVRRAKGGDPLTPVTVVVPTNTAGVMARRGLGRRGGAVAIDVLTIFRVAELLGAPGLVAAGRRPVSTPVVDVAVKQVLAADGGSFASVAHHPSTVVALRDLHRELRRAGPGAVTALAGTGRGREVARVSSAVSTLLRSGWYDEGDLLAAAIEAVERRPPARFARLVVHVPPRLRGLEVVLLRALGRAGDVELVVGRSGEAEADTDLLATVDDLLGGPHPATPDIPPTPAAGPVTVRSTTDADDEVRLAVRTLLDAARRATPFDRMAVVWPTDRPYARLVEHALDAAGVPWNGRPGTTTAERLVPRLLADLLELDRRGLRRRDLATLLADVPARRADGRRVPAAAWERVGRAAGITREADWDVRLPAWIEAEQARVAARSREADDGGTATDGRPTAADRGAELGAFVGTWRSVLGDPDVVRPWSEWRTWCLEQIDRWLGAGTLDRLDGPEREGWEQTQRVLDRLGTLDEIGGPVTRAEFRTTFVAELDVVPARRGKVGDGVHVGSLGGAAGLDVDVAVVLGAAEGLLPPAPAVDPLLGDADRAAAGLAGATERRAAVHRQFLAVTGWTPEVTVTVPRGDLRATIVHQPSRWLAASRRPVVDHVVDSHAHGLVTTEFPVSPAEHRLRELWSVARAGGDVRAHPLAHGDEALARALATSDARASDVFTVWDGDLTGRARRPIDEPVSPTRLEAWARCPHAFFMRYLLRVRPIDDPDEIAAITPLDRGSALHEALDRLHRAVLDCSLPAPGPGGWTADHARALAEIGAEIADDLHRAGRTGRAAHWYNDRADMLADLAGWIAADGQAWDGRRIISSEQPFGDDVAVALALPGGRTLRFHGAVDRIDELTDGTLVVTDHKTGGNTGYKGITVDDPTAGRSRFQLPAYGAAARVLAGRPDAPVRAEYSFLAKGRYGRTAIGLDDGVLARVGDDVAWVVDGIEAGWFPAHPVRPGWSRWVACEFCDPDGLGTAERWGEWERKRYDPRAGRWFAPEPDEGP